MRSPLQSKIASAMWIMTAVSTLASAVLAGWLLVTSHRESIRQQLQATATSLVALGITHFSELKDFEDLNRFVEDALQIDRIDKIIRVYDASQNLIFTTVGADYDHLPDRLKTKITKPIFMSVEGTHHHYETIILPYVGEVSKKTFYLQVAIRLPRYSEVLEYLWWQSALLLGLLIGISMFLSLWLSKRLAAPVQQIAEHLQRMDPARIEEWRPVALDEKSRYLLAIADGINQLADRTRSSMTQLRKMGRYVAHEMRTPLTILQGEAETVLTKPNAEAKDYKDVLRSSLEEIQRMSDIVSTVLQVGESSRLAAHQPVELELAQWFRDQLEGWEKVLGRRIALEIPSDKILNVTVDPKLLHRLIDNLIRNIRYHTPQDVRCTISLAALDNGTKVVVCDDGPGLSQEIIDSLNEKGGASELAGVGLGLCHRIAEICGVKILFANRPSGGLAVELVF